MVHISLLIRIIKVFADLVPILDRPVEGLASGRHALAVIEARLASEMQSTASRNTLGRRKPRRSSGRPFERSDTLASGEGSAGSPQGARPVARQSGQPDAGRDCSRLHSHRQRSQDRQGKPARGRPRPGVADIRAARQDTMRRHPELNSRFPRHRAAEAGRRHERRTPQSEHSGVLEKIVSQPHPPVA